VGLSEADEEVLDTSDGERVIVWHVARVRGGLSSFISMAMAVRCGGATSAFAHSLPTAAGLWPWAIAVTAAQAGSRPSRAYAFAVARYPTESIVLWGESLGSALAITIAAENPVGHVVLEAPFTSAADVGASHYWFVPVRVLMKDQFRSDLRVVKVTAPVLVLHGEEDPVVPVTLGERLCGLIRAPKRFVRIARAGHDDLGSRAVAAAKQFIAEQQWHVHDWMPAARGERV
jgi:fermentation-respiration switch protein FrsA (DUF1100 family)